MEIIRTSEQFLTIGIQWYVLLLGLISMSVALFNLLPLLPRDGGHTLISLVEGLRGRPVPRRIYERMSSFGMAAIVLVTIPAFANDLGAPAH